MGLEGTWHQDVTLVGVVSFDGRPLGLEEESGCQWDCTQDCGQNHSAVELNFTDISVSVIPHACATVFVRTPV